MLNVSKNVSHEELEKFQYELRNAAWAIKTSIDANQKDTMWGVLGLINSNNKKTHVRPEMFYKSRLFNVTELFNEEEEMKKSLDKIDFKNSLVKNNVKNIRKATQIEIAKMMKGS
jgi:hypothetical protein